LCFSDNVVEKSTALLVNKLREQSLSNIVLLQLSIDKNMRVQIDYEKEAGDVEFSREICPLIIFQTDNYWRVLAKHEGQIKQYHLNKILDVRMTDKKFKPMPGNEVEELFKYSWRSWLGTERFKVKLWFSKLWAERLTPKTLIDTEAVKVNDDGSVIYEATVNSLEEIAGWIVTRGSGVKVLEPKELKDKVLNLAEEVLANYEGKNQK
jgi:predicted DNA-binding transcriptional regulator YafY